MDYLQADQMSECFLLDGLQLVAVQVDGLQALPEVQEALHVDRPQLRVGKVNLLQGSQWRKLVGHQGGYLVVTEDDALQPFVAIKQLCWQLGDIVSVQIDVR